jgi:hypothetical protein
VEDTIPKKAVAEPCNKASTSFYMALVNVRDEVYSIA